MYLTVFDISNSGAIGGYFCVYLGFSLKLSFNLINILRQMKICLLDLMTRLSHNIIHQPARYCCKEQKNYDSIFPFDQSIFLLFFLEKTIALIPYIVFITKLFSLDNFTESTSWITSSSLTVCWEKIDCILHRGSTIIS